MRVFCTFRVCLLAYAAGQALGSAGSPASAAQLLRPSLPQLLLAQGHKSRLFPMNCPQGQDDEQDTTRDHAAQGDTDQDDAPEDDNAQDDVGQDKSSNPFAALSSTKEPVRKLGVLNEELGDLERATDEMTRMVRRGDSESIPSLLATVHLAIRGLRGDVQDIREHIRNRS